jgi:hypothetical protein
MPRRFYKYSLYQIQAFEETTGFTHIAIRRHDGKPLICRWDVLQAIKDSVAGKDRYAVEVFPDADSLINEENMRHLWVFPEADRLPLGPRWHNRANQNLTMNPPSH